MKIALVVYLIWLILGISLPKLEKENSKFFGFCAVTFFAFIPFFPFVFHMCKLFQDFYPKTFAYTKKICEIFHNFARADC